MTDIVPDKSLVQAGSFLKWAREEKIEEHMNDDSAKSSSNHSHYIRLVRNVFSLMHMGR